MKSNWIIVGFAVATLAVAGCQPADQETGEGETSVENPEQAAGDTATESSWQSEVESFTQSAEEQWSAFADWTVEQKDKMVVAVQDGLNRLDEQTESLQKRAGELSEDGQQQWQTAMESLKDKKAALSKQLEQAKEASSETWDKTKENVAAAYKAAVEAFQEAKARLSKKAEPDVEGVDEEQIPSPSEGPDSSAGEQGAESTDGSDSGNRTEQY